MDSEFFHGKDWESLRDRLDTNREFWVAKIERNMARDRAVNKQLISMGWTVLRFWSADVKKKLFAIGQSIEAEIDGAKKRINYLDSPFLELYSLKKSLSNQNNQKPNKINKK